MSQLIEKFEDCPAASTEGRRKNVLEVRLKDVDIKAAIDFTVKQTSFPWIRIGPKTAQIDLQFDYAMTAEIAVNPETHKLEWSLIEKHLTKLESKL